MDAPAWVHRWPMLAAPLLATALVAAQDGGPIVITQETPLELIHLEDIRAAFEFFGSLREDRVERPGAASVTDREQLFREVFELRSGGFIGHPNLIELDLLGRLQLEQRDVDLESTDRVGRNPEDINEFDVSGLILREGTLPVTLYARRTQTLIDRQFADTLDATTTEYGARMTLRSETMPSFFTYYHREQDQTSSLAGSDFNVDQHTVEWQTQLALDEDQRLDWDYSYDDVQESGDLRLGNTFERHDGVLTHTLDFGEKKRSDLRSTVHVVHETGRFPIDRIRVDERLRLRPTERLEYQLDYTFDQQDRPEARQDLHRGVAGIRHRLFDSLITNARAGASVFEIAETGFTSDQRFGNIDLDYTKLVPSGRLAATAAVNYNWQEDDGAGERQITDQVEVFGLSGVVTLIGRRIDPDSIVVTDAAGVQLFREGFDYLVIPFEERVELRRVLGGDISDGAVVLVDYRIGPEPANTTETTGLGFTLRYDIEDGPLRGLALYMRYLHQDQDRRGDPGLGPAADAEDWTFGAEYDLANLSLLGEWRRRDSDLSPFEVTRLEARYAERLGPKSQLTFSALYRTQTDLDTDDRTSTTTISGRWREQLDRSLTASLYVLWRQEDDRRGFDSEGFEQEIDLRWRYRQLELYATLNTSFLDTETADTDFLTFRFGLRREF
ncbi:MAG: hypothetical protein HKO59_16160 [Phycisphaerales bacterium]|nr:hypothetical protein [Phycisphaerae bacterium]NNF42920.1 hypothetical protein [Phycisphaerales bacterium]NNM27486.1 hypothetical protein [Phycisphaerales bacterium]